MTATLTLGGSTFAVNPTGLLSIKPAWQQEDSQAFYRLKPTGSLVFSQADWPKVQVLSACCTLAVLTLYSCSLTKPLQTVQINSQLMEWDFSTCSVTVPTVTIVDDYRGVYKYWEKKVNMLKLPSDLTVTHLYQKDATNAGETEKVYRSVGIANNRFRTWNAFFFYLIQQTFTGTEYEYVIPTVSSYSTLFTASTNPISNSSNIFLRTGIIQASDACEPGGDNAATGVLEKGGDNESMALSLKQVLEAFYVLFDASWLIDPVTKKFRIEHRLFFENGYSYETPQIGLNLTQARHKNALKFYTGNYKPKTDSLYGIEEVILTGNQALNASQYAFDRTYVKKDPYEFSFGKIDDFEYGNIKYDFDCAGRDDKGALIRNTRSTDLFYTMLDSIQFNDPAIDRTKWFICEYVPAKATSSTTFPRGNTQGTYTPGVAIGSTFAVGPVERTKVTAATNANFSATSLMRVFHRHGRSFSSGLMNYGEKVASQAGIYRIMYSVKPSKVPQPITVSVALLEEGFDPYRPVILPDGSRAVVEKATLHLWSNTIDLELITQSTCGGDIVPVPAGAIVDVSTSTDAIPPVSSGPAAGTKLRTEQFTVTCMAGGRSIGERTGTRTYYADGFGGEYIEAHDPCSSGTSTTPGSYNPGGPISRGPR